MGRIGYFVKDADNRGAALRAGALAHVPHARPAGRLLRRRAGLRRHRAATRTPGSRCSPRRCREYANQNLLDGTLAGSVDRYDTDSALYDHIAELAALRSAHPALATARRSSGYADGRGLRVLPGRRDGEGRAPRRDEQRHRRDAVTIDTLTPGARSRRCTGRRRGVTAAADGTVSVTIPALSAIVLKAGTTGRRPRGARRHHARPPRAGRRPVGRRRRSAPTWPTTCGARRRSRTACVGDDDVDPAGHRRDHVAAGVPHVTGLPDGALVEYRAVTVDAAGQKSAASTFASVGGAPSTGSSSPRPGPGEDLFVTVPGSHNSEMGCPGDWQPDCEAPADKGPDGIYSGTFSPAGGSYEYKVAIGGTWDVNYGAGGVAGGANVAYTVAGDGARMHVLLRPRDPLLHPDHARRARSLTLPGSAQSELGCPGGLGARLPRAPGSGRRR